jgi:hypothetical protein
MCHCQPHLAALLEQGFERFLHVLEIERLRQQDRVLEALALVQPAVAGGESERHTARAKGVGKRIAGTAGKVHVEDGAVQLPVGEREPVGNRASRAHDFAAELAEPILNQH